MAAKENQGLQAIAITFAILTFILLGTTIAFYKMRQTEMARAAAAQADLGKSSSAQAQLQDEANNYKLWMGFGEGDAREVVETGYKEDMNRFGANMTEESRKYRTILDNIFEENRKLALNEANAKAQVKDLKDRLLAVETQKEMQVKKAEDEMKKVATDAQEEKRKFDEQYSTINADKDKIAKQLQDQLAKGDELTANLREQKLAADNEAQKFERSIDKLRAGLPDVDQFAQPADGRINWVNQKYQSVWINLGSADGLRPQVTFSVAPEGLGDAEAAKKKGSIEVVRIVGPHLAEARITKDDSTNPLLPGDRIYSQVWDRGRKVGFGIAGFIDIDKDGTNDLELLKNIIAASNGRVDAATDPKGKKVGELNIDTRFLVLGEFPNDPIKSGFRVSWQELSDEAERLGVQTIALEEFLKLMGWQSRSRTVTLAGRIRAEDFPVQAPDYDTPPKAGTSSDLFKPRLPPGAY